MAAATALVVATFSAGCSQSPDSASGEDLIRIGYLNNVTHVQALASIARDDMLGRLGGFGSVQMRAFNAGPAAIDAISAGALDAAYVGPTGALNAHFRAHGELAVIVAGAASGGARLMVSATSGIVAPEDFSGRTVATPGVANTQDISLRSWLAKEGLAPREKGGTVSVRPIANPDIYQLMLRGQLDAAWVPEPWATRLQVDAGARTFLDERSLWPDGEFSAVTLVVSRRSLDTRPDQVRRLVTAHVSMTRWVIEHPQEAMQAANDGLARNLGKPLASDIVETAFSYFRVTDDPLTPTIRRMASEMIELGYVPEGERHADLAPLFSLGILDSEKEPAK